MENSRTTHAKTWALLTVAAVAAGVSYFHIVNLALSFRLPLYTAAVLPFSIDGLIVCCSMQLHESAKDGRGHALASLGVWIGVLVTATANVGYGVTANLGHGWIHLVGGAVGAGMPAVAFVIAAHVTIISARRTTRKRATQQATVAQIASQSTRKRGADSSNFAPVVAKLVNLLRAGEPIPGQRELARTEFGGNRHEAKRAIETARATARKRAA